MYNSIIVFFCVGGNYILVFLFFSKIYIFYNLIFVLLFCSFVILNTLYFLLQIRLIAVSLLVSCALARPQGDPCHPSPCGPNTSCSVGGNGAAVCRCLAGFFPKPNTIVGCGSQCVKYEQYSKISNRVFNLF